MLQTPNDKIEPKPPVRNYLSSDDLKAIEEIFSYHAPKGDQQERYMRVRADAKAVASTILAYVPPCQERALAIEKLREAVMWANCGISCNE